MCSRINAHQKYTRWSNAATFHTDKHIHKLTKRKAFTLIGLTMMYYEL